MYRTYVYVDGHPLARHIADAQGIPAAPDSAAPWRPRASPHRAPSGTRSGPAGCWVDLLSLMTSVLPLDYDLRGIRYYAGEVPDRLRNPTQGWETSRRHTHFTRPGPAIVRLPRPTPPPMAAAGEYETSLAAHLLRDGANDLYDVAVILADDPALARPVQVVTRYLGKRVGVLWPSREDAGALAEVCSFVRYVSGAHLATGVIPAELQESPG